MVDDTKSKKAAFWKFSILILMMATVVMAFHFFGFSKDMAEIPKPRTTTTVCIEGFKFVSWSNIAGPQLAGPIGECESGEK